MKTTFISKENNEVKFTMDFTAEEFEAAVVKAYQASKGQFMIDGFRKGKAPRLSLIHILWWTPHHLSSTNLRQRLFPHSQKNNLQVKILRIKLLIIFSYYHYSSFLISVNNNFIK